MSRTDLEILEVEGGEEGAESPGVFLSSLWQLGIPSDLPEEIVLALPVPAEVDRLPLPAPALLLATEGGHRERSHVGAVGEGRHLLSAGPCFCGNWDEDCCDTMLSIWNIWAVAHPSSLSALNCFTRNNPLINICCNIQYLSIFSLCSSYVDFTVYWTLLYSIINISSPKLNTVHKFTCLLWKTLFDSFHTYSLAAKADVY